MTLKCGRIWFKGQTRSKILADSPTPLSSVDLFSASDVGHKAAFIRQQTARLCPNFNLQFNPSRVLDLVASSDGISDFYQLNTFFTKCVGSNKHGGPSLETVRAVPCLGSNMMGQHGRGTWMDIYTCTTQQHSALFPVLSSSHQQLNVVPWLQTEFAFILNTPLAFGTFCSAGQGLAEDNGPVCPTHWSD